MALVATAALVAGTGTPAPFAQTSGEPLSVLSRDGRRRLPVTTVGGRDYVALDEIAAAFGLSVREDQLAGGVTVTAGSTTILLTEAQTVISVGGRLVSLPSPPVRQADRWLVPLDFLPRALGPALGTTLDLRRSSGLLVVGDLRVPRVVARVETTAAGATLTFDMAPATGATVTAANGVLVVSFDADAIDLSVPALPTQAFVLAVSPASGAASLQVLTGPGYATHRTTATPADGAATRLTLEIRGTAAETPDLPTQTGPTEAPPPAPLMMPEGAGVRTLVIDPGHGGDDHGAVGPAGTREKDVTLAIARRLRTVVETRLGLRVYLTRDDDRALPLDSRTAFANSHRADVFLSIHANAALQPATRGAEVYYLRGDEAEIEARRAAVASGTVVPVLGGGTRSIALILWDAAQAGYLERSAALASVLERALGERVEMSPRAVRQAPFRVLVGTTMPAALVEVGYLSNPEQERQLASAAHQDRIVQALYDALVAFRGSIERSASPQ